MQMWAIRAASSRPTPSAQVTEEAVRRPSQLPRRGELTLSAALNDRSYAFELATLRTGAGRECPLGDTATSNDCYQPLRSLGYLSRLAATSLKRLSVFGR